MSAPLALLFTLAACADDGTSAEASGSNSNSNTLSSGGTGTDGDEYGTSADTGDGDGGDGDGDPGDGDGDGDPGECVDGEEQCKEDGHEICEGGQWQPDPCPEGTFCDEVSDACEPCACVPGEQGGCTDMDNIETCTEDCSGYAPEPCDPGICVEGECVNLICAPDQSACVDGDSYHVCNGEGTMWGEDMDCPPGDSCLNGSCVSACDLAEATKSNVGCEFWAVDMSNLPPRDTYTYSVVVSNPSFDTPTDVTIWDKRNGNETMLIDDQVAPREAKVFNLSGSHNGYMSYYNGQDAGFLGNGVGQGKAFRIETSLPVLATQFNPIGGASGFTTDASLLLPTHTLGQDYIHLGWNRGHGDGSSMNVIATEDDTTITITPKVNTGAGQNGLPAMTAGVPTEVVINRYDYIQIGVDDQNLTGSRISADKPVALFGGHSCANVPTESVGACDHVEEQLFPLETWGTNYVAARNPPRGNETMRWRIVAAEDNTTINFDPAVSIGAQTVLNAGELVEFDELQDFYISADDPILVAGYMRGGSSAGGQGDPYMVQMVAVEQYKQDYVFLVDSSYTNDFAKLVRPAGTEVTVECLGVVPDNRWTSIGASGYDYAVIDMNPGEAMCSSGTNEASASDGFGIIVSGQASYASYGYPGGLALEQINPQ
ncbi:IgGFc-binding protein [Enhygromyxa salina]|uniref:IgGFc-binding protein n=1 Tax=Enhygromyxa salina TaxID=215803 RepID=UPI0015E60CCD|nr:IgGFc-binding protein [Enhygromyxa salina]